MRIISPYQLAIAYAARCVNPKQCWLWVMLLFPAASIAAQPLQAVSLQGERVVLADGSRHLLAGIVMVKPEAARLPEGWQDAPVALECLPANRYGESPCWVRRVGDDALLQAALLAQGGAMAYSPYVLPEMPALLAQDETVPESAETVSAAAERWAYIGGKLHAVVLRKEGAYLNFGDDWKQDFTINLPKAVLKRFDRATLQALSGRQVRVRGWLHSYYGPRITLHNPQMLEVLP